MKDFAENDELVTTMIRKDKEAAKDLDVRTEVRAKIRSIAMKKTVNRRTSQSNSIVDERR